VFRQLAETYICQKEHNAGEQKRDLAAPAPSRGEEEVVQDKNE
jgi:hypothetical protein